MTLKFISVLVPSLLFSSSLPAESTQENPPPHEDRSVSQEDTPHSTHTQLRDIHNFHLTFDDYALGGMTYESFE